MVAIQQPDFVGMIIPLFWEYVPYLLAVPFLVSSIKEGLNLSADAINGRRKGRDALLGLFMVGGGLAVGWIAYNSWLVSLLVSNAHLLHGASLDAKIDQVRAMPSALLFLAKQTPWLIPAMAVGLLIFGRIAKGPVNVGKLHGVRRKVQTGNQSASLKGVKGEKDVASEVARLRLPTLHDIVLADSRGLTQIDHVVLAPGGIVVLETKAFAGLITGNEHSATWTQHLASGSTKTKFQNPVRQNYRHCSAVTEVVANSAVVVRGYVVTAGPAKFSDGVKNLVVRVDELSELFTSDGDLAVDAAALQAAWDKLVMAAGTSEKRREDHLQSVLERQVVPT